MLLRRRRRFVSVIKPTLIQGKRSGHPAIRVVPQRFILSLSLLFETKALFFLTKTKNEKFNEIRNQELEMKNGGQSL